MEIGWSVALGLLGAGALWGLYRALELNWPDQYSSLNDTFALKVTQSWWRFLSFRFVPIFVAAAAVAVTTTRVEGTPGVAVFLMTAIHLSHSNVRAVVESVRRTNPSGKIGVNYNPFHIATIILAIVAAILGLFASPGLARFIPRPHVLIENLWIAAFVTVVGALAISIIGKRPDGSPSFGSSYFIDRAAKDVGLHTVDTAYRIALEEGCDPLLLRAIMFTEVLQRPRWVRTLERVKGRAIPRGSYGVTQEKGDRPLSDEDSLRLTARRITGVWAAKFNGYYWESRDGAIWRCAATHNPDVIFVGTVQEIYRELLSSPWANTIHWDNDPTSPLAHIFEVRRNAQDFCLRGFSTGASIEVETTGSVENLISNTANPTTNEVWAFEIPIPVDAESVTFSVYDSEHTLLGALNGQVNAATVQL